MAQAMELLNCVTGRTYDEAACVTKLRALRACALKHGVKQFETGPS